MGLGTTSLPGQLHGTQTGGVVREGGGEGDMRGRVKTTRERSRRGLGC